MTTSGGQAVRLLGGAKPNDLVRTGDKFRITWRWSLADYLAGSHFDVRRYDRNVLDWLPSQNLLPVSNAMAVPGDEVIVYDVRLGSQWGAGRTVADVIIAADKLPFMDDLSLDVYAIEPVSASATSADIASGLASSVVQGNANSAGERDDSLDFFGDVGEKLDKYATILVVGAVLVAAVYFYRK